METFGGEGEQCWRWRRVVLEVEEARDFGGGKRESAEWGLIERRDCVWGGISVVIKWMNPTAYMRMA